MDDKLVEVTVNCAYDDGYRAGFAEGWNLGYDDGHMRGRLDG